MTPTTVATETITRQRGVQLLQLHPSTQDVSDIDTGIDIIAIHGFDTKSPETWQYKREDGNKINWLADEHMLPKQVPGTRIFTCDWPAELFETKDAVPFEIEELARLLLQAILGPSIERDRSILFIASCLGGLILMKALVEAENEYATIRRATRGVIFLATPFRGTSFENVAKWAQPGLQAWASIQGQQVSNLLHLVKSPTVGLADLVSQFTKLYPIHGPEAVKVHTFYESRFTSLHRKVPCISSLLPRSRKVLVNMSSGTLDYVVCPVPLDRPHVLMNKFQDPNEKDYVELVNIITRVLKEIRTGSPLEQADSWIRQEHYNEEKLTIQRLSGDRLEMDQCYINLVLVKTQQTDTPGDTQESISSPFTLSERLRVQTPHKNLMVELLKLFDPRSANETPPRRILIRGRAGVGKTTLCKKIVHDFVNRGMWKSLFKHLVWVQLRNLQGLPEDKYNLGGMLKSIFFQQHNDAESLGEAMRQHIEKNKAQDTIFLLDGLDEVNEIITNTGHKPPHRGHDLLKKLLNMPNVIITTRPHSGSPFGVDPVHIELDTIGFSPDQVRQYIETVMPNDKDAIEAYLQKTRIMQDLVRLPIQLDALCYTWQESSWYGDSSNAIPETMTAVYEAMKKKLRKKDNDRLLKAEPMSSAEHNDLGYLAFSGLCGNVIEFSPGKQREQLYRHMLEDRQVKGYEQTLALEEDDTFARLFCLSFLRTSGTSKAPKSSNSQSFHFIHLTFQEYFAAKHFVKAWKIGQTICYTELDGGQAAMREIRKVSCHEFLQKHKYNARYDIMLRFVAGLLDAEGDSYITNFFEALEREPIDLLGPTHQRLIMHCVAELMHSNDLRARLESQLSQWLELECSIRSTSLFATQTELSERVLILVLEEASESLKMTILSALSKRQNVSLHMMGLVASWLQPQNASQQLRIAALQTLSQASQCLPTQILKKVLMCTDYEDVETINAAVWVLLCQEAWPEDFLREVTADIESPDAGARNKIARLLGGQRQLPESILRTVVSWLERRDDSTPSSSMALEVLGYQSELPVDITRALAAKLNDPDTDAGIQVDVFEILNIQPAPPENMKIISEQMAAWLEDQYDDLEDEVRPTTDRKARRRPLGGRSSSLLQAIFLRLNSQDGNIQTRAMRLLQRTGDHQRLLSESFYGEFIEVMVSWVGFQDSTMRKFALEALSCDATLPECAVNTVVAHILKEDGDLRWIACKCLRHQSTFSDNIWSVILSWLQNEDSIVRRTALEVLRCERALPSGVLKAVLAQLEDQDRSIRELALTTLRDLWGRGCIPDDIFRAVTAKLHDSDGAVAKAALKILRGVLERQALPDDVAKDVVAQLNHQDTKVREAALSLFERWFIDVRCRDEQTFPDGIIHAIAAQLKHPDRGVRCHALWALRAFGSRHAFPEGVLEAVVKRVQDHDRWNRSWALQALQNQGTTPGHDWQATAVDRLKDVSEVKEVKCTALRVLEGRQTWHDNTLAAVAARVKDRDESVRCRAIGALAGRIELPEPFLSFAFSFLSSEEAVVKREALEIFQSQRLSASLAETMLQKFKHAELGSKLAVLAVLRAQPNLPEPILSGTMPWIQDKEWKVRRSVVDLLGTDTILPRVSLQSWEAITTLLDDDNFEVRQAVLTAMRNRRALPDAVLSSKALYPLWLKKCFEEHSYCYIEDGKVHLELPGGFGKVCLEGDPDTFRTEICNRQSELVMSTLVI